MTRKFSSKSLTKSGDFENEANAVDPCKNDETSKKPSFNHQDSIESYKQILENFKDILPEDFTLRKFPYSSCPDTFESNTDVSEYASSENKSTLDFMTVPSISASSSPSLANHEAISNIEADVNKKANNLDDFEVQKSSDKNIANKLFTIDAENSSNKRFYHVFTKNELDNLVRENFSNLIICNSYYDHGNYCIIAQKI